MWYLDESRVAAMHTYLSAGSPELQPANGAFVFGRADKLLGRLTASLYNLRLIDWALITGGVGKDSADLVVPESVFLGRVVRWRGMPAEAIHCEISSTNGGENCRFGLDILGKPAFRPQSLIVVAHAPSVRRLTMMLEGEIAVRGLSIGVQSVGTGYSFKPWWWRDALEVAQEYLRMAEWPAKYGYPENNLDRDLVKYARTLVHELGPI